MKNRGLGYERSLLLLLGSLSMFLYGTIYSWSIFIEPLETEFSWSRSQVTMAYSIGMVALYIGMTLHGVLASKKSSRYSMLLGASLILAGYSTASRIGPDMQDIARLLVLWLSYGVCGGLGVGICYNGWLTTVVERLPDRPGLASGLLLMGMGIGGFASAQAADLMIRSFLGWRHTLLVFGLLMGMMSLLSIGFLAHVTKDTSSLRLVKQAGSDVGPSEMLRKKSFWAFMLWKMVLLCSGSAVIGQAARIAADAGASPSVSSVAVGLLSIGNAVSRAVFGVLADKMGQRKTMLSLASVMLVASLVLAGTYQMKIPATVAVCLFLFGICYGGSITISPNYIRSMYGYKYLKTNIGVSSLISCIPTLAVSSLIGAIKTTTGSYASFFWIVTGTSILSIWFAIGASPSVDPATRGRTSP